MHAALQPPLLLLLLLQLHLRLQPAVCKSLMQTQLLTNQSFNFAVPENVPVGYAVGRLSVVSYSSSSSSSKAAKHTSFQIVQSAATETPSCSVDAAFTVDNAGVLRSRGVIDHEMCKRYVFQVLATDLAGSGLQEVASVNLTVTDLNDNAPRFVFPTPLDNSVRLTLLSADQPLVSIAAVDADAELQCAVSYSLGDSSGLFQVDKLSGELRLARQATMADIGQHKLLVVASDCAPAQHNTTAKLTVTIEYIAEPYEVQCGTDDVQELQVLSAANAKCTSCCYVELLAVLLCFAYIAASRE